MMLFYRRCVGIIMRFCAEIIRLQKNSDGNFAILTAFLSLVIFGVVGIALNVGVGLNTKRMLQQATDSGATGAANAVMAGVTDVTQIENIANRLVKANLAQMGASYATPTISVSVSTVAPKSVTVISSTVMPTIMGGIVGLPEMPISSKTVVSLGLGQVYYQLIFLTDNSGSMSIGGTAADISRLENHPQIQCGFACHDPYGERRLHFSGEVADKRTLAASLGIKLKFDYVKDAIADFMLKIRPAMLLNRTQFAISVNSFATTYTNFQPFTGDPAILDAAIGRLDLSLGETLSATDIANGISGAVATISNIGDGSSPAKRKTYLVLLTDGVNDRRGGGGGKWPIDGSSCDIAKSKGINVIAVQTSYPTNLDDNGFKRDVLPILPAVASGMKACASSEDLYFEGDNGPAIAAAMEAAFAKIFGSLYISE